MPLMDRWKSALSGLDDGNSQCSKDLLLAASFVRSLESTDQAVNLEIRQVSQQLDSLAKQLMSQSGAKAA